ncbi:MAG: leucyl aminopeptidase [Bryobacterales bacterium]|nr:leucyl aminopeptidase [Bryobacterales bacterium]
MIDESTMQFALTDTRLHEIEADAALGFAYGGDGDCTVAADWSELTAGLARELVERGEFRAKHQSAALMHRPAGMRAGRLLLVGCGPRATASAARLREAAGAGWRCLRTAGVRRLAVALPDGMPRDEALTAVVQGIAAADYEPDAYKTADRQASALERVVVSCPGAARPALQRGVAIAHGQRRARELVNEPGNLLPPRELAARAAALAAEAGLECEVLDKSRLEELRMGALLGVARGSLEPPVMIVLRYRPESGNPGRLPHLGLVGKAVTFDTGGISLKPAADMHRMEHDRAGGAAMIGTMLALASVRPRLPVTAVIPSVENMPGAGAQRPGDVVTTRCGKTVEVLNTDAEGRLILADALTYANEQGCTHLVDAATLTGAVVVALGTEHTGLFSNNHPWREQLLGAASRAGERMWPMPIGEEYAKLLDSPIADMANIGPRWGGACTAAAFLEPFAAGTPWAHLDIAGTAWYEKKMPHAPVGPSGAGVPTLVQLALDMSR